MRSLLLNIAVGALVALTACCTDKCAENNEAKKDMGLQLYSIRELIGDINPEVLTIATVFGANDVVNKSLDLSKENFKPTQWMCTISSYSIWWMITHYQWYMYTGNRKYLDEQKDYVTELLGELMKYVDDKGYEKLNARFLDWPSSENPKGIDAGLQALMAIAFDSGAKLETIWGNTELAKKCSDISAKMKK